MDDHSGFWDNGPEVLRTERRLIAAADLVVASSRRLYEGIRAQSRSAILVRNACEYEHFSAIGDRPRPRAGRPTIGYYGAIAEWFDARLVAAARRDAAGLAIRADRLDARRRRPGSSRTSPMSACWASAHTPSCRAGSRAGMPSSSRSDACR